MGMCHYLYAKSLKLTMVFQNEMLEVFGKVDARIPAIVAEHLKD
jgi:hypothetical protein